MDGFNPCAFSIVIVLAGVLAAGGRRRRARLLGAAAFCAGSYLTYMAMGFGLLFAVLSLSLMVLSVLSFRDAWRYRAARVPAVITLQLPDGVKRAIRAVAEASWAGPAVVGTGLLCEFANALLAVASSPDTLPGNRVSALALAADRGLVAALPSARHWAKSGETPLLRDVAAKAVRTLAWRRVNAKPPFPW